MKQQQMYNVAIYLRLSKDDDMGNESTSISTQKEMLTEYVKKNGWRITDYYIDDGISGTNFDRKGFNKMISDIDEGKINLVITKDLSRLGRDYLKTGFYTECYFPENDVRYIALNDGIDTIRNDNDIAPFKNILNEMYAKDISKKIKSAYRVKIKRGDYHGAFAPFGYAKDPDRKGKLIIDPESSVTVRLIFSLASKGYGAARIRTELTKRKLLTPSAYLHKVDKKYYHKLYSFENPAIPYAWSINMVERILDNEVYIGNIIHYKEISVSYKTKRRQNQSRDKWLRSENTHKAIIDRDVWEMLQERYRHKGSYTRVNPPSVFQRIVRCADCGKIMWLATPYKNKRTGKKNGNRYLACSTNRNFGKIKCSMHCTSYNALYHHVLQEICYYAKLAKEIPEQLLKTLNDRNQSFRQVESNHLIERKVEVEVRLADVKMLIKKLYEDETLGRLTSENIYEMMSGYQEEQKILLEKLEGLTKDIDKMNSSLDGSMKWIELIADYDGIEKLDVETISQLFEKILVHESKKANGRRYQKLELYYNYVGKVSAANDKNENAIIGSRKKLTI